MGHHIDRCYDDYRDHRRLFLRLYGASCGWLAHGSIGITAFTCFYARKRADNSDDSFGTGKVGLPIISRWSFGLLRDTSSILLDRSVDRKTVEDIKSAIEDDSDNRVSDIHVWIVGSHQLSAIISIVTHFPKDPEHYKKLLTGFKDLVHVTVEANESKDEPCIEPK